MRRTEAKGERGYSPSSSSGATGEGGVWAPPGKEELAGHEGSRRSSHVAEEGGARSEARWRPRGRRVLTVVKLGRCWGGRSSWASEKGGVAAANRVRVVDAGCMVPVVRGCQPMEMGLRTTAMGFQAEAKSYGLAGRHSVAYVARPPWHYERRDKWEKGNARLVGPNRVLYLILVRSDLWAALSFVWRTRSAPLLILILKNLELRRLAELLQLRLRIWEQETYQTGLKDSETVIRDDNTARI